MTEASNKQQAPDPQDNKWRQIARYSGLGMEMAAAIIGMAVLGRYLDNRMSNQQPVLTLIFSALGVIYIFVKIFKLAGDDQ